MIDKIPLLENKSPKNLMFNLGLVYFVLILLSISSVIFEAFNSGFTSSFFLLLAGLIIMLAHCLLILKRVIPSVRRIENLEDKLLEERVVSEILDQDIKLLQIKNLEIDYNLKINQWNKYNPKRMKNSLEWRTLKKATDQAFDMDFYEKTYGYRMIDKKIR